MREADRLEAEADLEERIGYVGRARELRAQAALIRADGVVLVESD